MLKRLDNQNFVLVLFCIGIVFYGIGDMSLGKSLFGGIRAQSFFHIGGVVFILYNYKRFSKIDFKHLLIPIISFLVVFILGLLTYFDTTMQSTLKGILRSANQHIIGYFVLCYFFARYARLKVVHTFLAFFALVCSVNLLLMLYLGFKNGFFTHNNVLFFFKAVYTYNIWLIAPMAIGIAGFVAIKNLAGKLAFLGVAILALFGMFSNGERSFLVASFVMIFVPFIVWKYKFKVKALLALPILLMLSLFSFYHFSKNLPERWNFAHMIDHFFVVINPVIQMGQYDKVCFNKHSEFECYQESVQNGLSNIAWEHSSLSRIAMSKSTLKAFLDNPIKPHLIGVFQTGEYLFKYYEANPHKAHNRMYATLKDDPINNGYNSPHNFAINLLFNS